MPFGFTQFPISRQGLQDIAMFLIAGAVLFGVLALVRRQRGGDVRSQVQAIGALAVLVVVAYVLAFTFAPNIPTPAVPFTARFARNPVADTPDNIAAARATFQTNCAICHGPRGLGDGPAAFTLNPRPVNLQLHVPQHAEGEIFYWISEGVAGTGMPAWKDKLTEEQRWQVVRYLEALASGRVQQ
jgi:mono/diheme cytochrome c family protein